MNKTTKSLVRMLATVVVLASQSATQALATGNAMIGDTVWNDINGNGIQEPGELGLPDVTVNLRDCGDITLATSTTDSNGNYLFANLDPGCYVVRFKVPEGMVFSPQDLGGNEATDSDANPKSGKTAPINLAAGENNPNVDVGLHPPAALFGALGDRVWDDLNANGIQDANEPGLDDIQVRLTSCSGTILATTKTANGGQYQFTNLIGGCYLVGFVDIPSTYLPSLAAQGNNGSLNSDVTTFSQVTLGRYLAESDDILLLEGELNRDTDFGLYRPARLGGKVFLGKDKKGKEGKSSVKKPGVPDTVVTLQNCNGNTLRTNFTDANGNYDFVNLPPGCYVVMLNAPNGVAFSLNDPSDNDGTNSDVDPSTGKTRQIILKAGENNLNVNIGVRNPVASLPPTPIPLPVASGTSLGDRVWNDLNANSIQDKDEPGIDGIQVQLKSCSGAILTTTVTANNGQYLFTNLSEGCYLIRFINIPDTYLPSLAHQGGDGSRDSDAPTFSRVTPGVYTAESEDISLSEGELNRDIDLGLYRPARLGGNEFRDKHKNGVQRGKESGVSDVTVALQDCNANTLRTNVTDEQGNYAFVNLSPGCYMVMFSAPNGALFSPQDQGDNDAADSDVDPRTGKTGQIILKMGEDNSTVDAGIFTRK